MGNLNCKNTVMKKFLAVMLVLAMVFTALPVQAFAADDGNNQEPEKQIDILDSISFSSNSWDAGFKPDVHEYTVAVPGSENPMWANFEFSKDIPSDENIEYEFQYNGKKAANGAGVNGDVKAGESKRAMLMAFFMQTLKKSDETLAIDLVFGTRDEDGKFVKSDKYKPYTFNFYKNTDIKALTLNAVNEGGTATALSFVPKLAPGTYNYTVKIPEDAKSIKVSGLTLGIPASNQKVDGNAIPSSAWYGDTKLSKDTEIQLSSLTKDSDGLYHMPVDVRFENKLDVKDSNKRDTSYEIIFSDVDIQPSIKTQPQDISCNKGDKVTLNIDVEKPQKGNLSYQWYKWNSIRKMSEPIEGATSKEYVPSTEDGLTTYYYCDVTNKFSTAQFNVESEKVKVEVTATEPSAPIFSYEPGKKVTYNHYEMRVNPFQFFARAKDANTDIDINLYAALEPDTTKGVLISENVGKQTSTSMSESSNVNGANLTYTPSSEMTGSIYYYAVATATIGDKSVSSTSNLFQVEITPLEDEVYVNRALDDLKVEETAYENFKLPSSGPDNVNYKWSSANPKVLSDKGVVRRGKEDVTVSLTVTGSKGETSKSKSYSVLVPKEAESGLDVTAKALSKISLWPEYINNIDLPADDGNGITFSWKSSDEAIVSTKGIVNRPEAGSKDGKVTLTATAVSGGLSSERAFEVTVPAKQDVKTNEGQIKEATYLSREYYLKNRIFDGYWDVYAAYAALGEYIQDPANDYYYDTRSNSVKQVGAHVLAVVAMGENPYNYKHENLMEKLCENPVGEWSVPTFNTMGFEAAGSDFDKIPLKEGMMWMNSLSMGPDMGGWSCVIASRHLDNPSAQKGIETFTECIKDNMAGNTMGSAGLSMGCVVTGYSSLMAAGLKGYDVTKDSPWVEQDPIGLMYSNFVNGENGVSTGFSNQYMMEFCDLYNVMYNKGNVGWLSCGVSKDKLDKQLEKAQTILNDSKNYTTESISALNKAVKDTKAISSERLEKAVADYGREYYALYDAVKNAVRADYYEDEETINNRKKAKEVDALIELIPRAEKIKLSDEAVILKAEDAYEKLTAEQKKFVENYGDLSTAISTLNRFKAERAKDLIDAIGNTDTITLNSENAIIAARNYYEGLNEEQKKLVTNLELLNKAEKRLADLKAEAGNKKPEADDKKPVNENKKPETVNPVTTGNVSTGNTGATGSGTVVAANTGKSQTKIVTAENKDEKKAKEDKPKAIQEKITDLIKPEDIKDNLSDSQLRDIVELYKDYDKLSKEDKEALEKTEEFKEFKKVLEKAGEANHKDKASGAIVSSEVKDALPWYVKVSTEEKELTSDQSGALKESLGEDSKVLKTFEISFKNLLTGKEWEPGDTIKVRIKLTDLQGFENAAIYHIKDDGSVEVLKATVKDGYVEFETTSFSEFSIVGINGKLADKLPTEGVEEAKDVSKAVTWPWILGGTVAIIAVIAVVVISKKHASNE